ncbi:transposase [Glutamicibacter sp. PS]|uniref:transposase n=1 Tax=Glutamicibacter sp. PS TaxID=3075634 RepID=UPI002844B04A|nr:transposase [Glutamicibacter sp. PS]MDR4533046.1 transposase [Glutamicibacter sp. PS]
MSHSDRQAVSKQLKSIYTAPSIESAGKHSTISKPARWGKVSVGGGDVAHRVGAVHRVSGVRPELRKVIYTTNAIESMNYQLRKVTKIRGHIPSDAAAVKMLWLVICSLEDKRAWERLKGAHETGRTPRPGTGSRLLEGAGTNGWMQALKQLAMTYPERIEP